MFRKSCFAILAISAVSNAQVAFDNGAYITHASGGPSNAPRSTLQNSGLQMATYGFGCQRQHLNRCADDFAVPASAKLRVLGFQFYAYQTSAVSNTMNHANVRIWNGAPNGGGSIVAGDAVTNLFSSAASTGAYRVDDLTGGATVSSRLVMAVSANLASPIVLNTGTYWADWQLDGTLASGPWQVPVTLLGQTGKPGANAIQFLSANNAWRNADDSGSLTRQDFALRVIGRWLVNPISVVVVEGSLLGGNASSLGASDNNRYLMLMDEFDSNSNVEMTSTSPTSSVTLMTISVEMSAGRNDLGQFIDAQNTSSVWENLDASTSSLTDITRVVNVASNPNRFIRPTNQLKLRVRTIPQGDIDAADGWSHGIDWVEWELSPG